MTWKVVLCYRSSGASQAALVVKNLPVNAGDARDMVLITGLERPPEVGNGNLFRDSCLGNPMDRGAWQVTVHGAVKIQT